MLIQYRETEEIVESILVEGNPSCSLFINYDTWQSGCWPGMGWKTGLLPSHWM